MKTHPHIRDRRENRAERQEKLGSACDTLPANTLANQTGASKARFEKRTSLQSVTERAHKEERHVDMAAGSSSPLALKSGPAARAAKTIVTLRLAAPDAVQVMIAGTFGNWSPQRMSRGAKDGQGPWQIDLPLKPGSYEYRFIVDGMWIDDPSATVFVPNGLGDRNAVLVVPR